MDAEALNRRARARGVTLIELLVVMAILAFLAGVVILNGPPLNPEAKSEAEKFAARARAAWEQSVLDGAVYAIAVAPGRYEVEKLVNGEWKPAEGGRYFASREAPRGVTLTARLMDPAALNKALERKAGAPDAPARIILDPIGVTTPFAVEFSGRSGVWVVRNLPDETLVLERKAE